MKEIKQISPQKNPELPMIVRGFTKDEDIVYFPAIEGQKDSHGYYAHRDGTPLSSNEAYAYTMLGAIGD